ncbi:oxidoreductase [Pilatotrama ljubarskyi]|nr:oxidoreductase [Pilatotrama ljubarskyi]
MAPKMEYVRLGNSGLKVSKIILGCMSYGDPRWQEWVLGEEEAIKHIKFAYDHGITSFDTANVYSNGLSETILGNAIKKLGLPREELVIMTKLWAPVPSDPGKNSIGKTPEELLEMGIINQHGLNRKHIFDSVKASLKRLQLDYIDLLQCHRFDYNTPIEETMQALHDVVQAGYVRYIGMSSCYAYQFHQMQNYAITHNLTPFISMQNHYSLLYREEEREMFPTLKLFGVGSIPWSPLARGKLTRPLDAESKRGKTDRFQGFYNSEPSKEIINRVEELAKKKGVSMAQLSLAWIMSKPGVTAPIIGTTSLSNLEDILGSLDVKLDEEEIRRSHTSRRRSWAPCRPTDVSDRPGADYESGGSPVIKIPLPRTCPP